ncbi:hypothetical protein A2I98_15120 [Pseudoalteromonas agarivorans]|uniref:NHL repeat-containing protein n=1 Tax=Pseudoalteromonas agarivorans TaxID=176102 RepID=A0ABR5VS53_9GAMM|nr:hypothetical protein [Pseudoalteromonas telluritireducens]KYL33076.1 hypothetical protein A2I98_15120 [Pseudoalteromonas telluritireducens]
MKKANLTHLHTQNSSLKRPLCFSALALGIVLGISGCSGDDGENGLAGTPGADGQDGSDGTNGNPGFSAATFILANNGEQNAGTVDLINQNAAKLKTFNTTANEGIAFDSLGNLIQASDSENGSIKTICQLANRDDGASFSTNQDREITGPATTLVNPKGIAIAKNSGLIFIADFGAMQITTFGSAAAGDAAPLATTVTEAAPWDVDYDHVNDRLYVALTNGDVAVYDNFVSGEFTAMPSRTITPSDADGVQISVNIHGIVYDETTNKLILSDVGSASDATDGALFVINNASTAQGNTSVARSISGPATMLGNPVDITLEGSDLRVAEKSNDAILVFSNIFAGESGDIAPDLSTASTKPESITNTLTQSSMPDISDSTEPNMALLGVAVSSNPSTAGDTTGQISRLNTALSSELASYNASQTIESVSFDKAGNSYATFDNASTGMGGIVISTKVAYNRDGETFNASQDRLISGSNTGLISPKGLDIASDSGMIFVAENNETTPSIAIFSSCATGDVSPLMTLTFANNARPWDVDYDSNTDRAFVALTNGTVAVFDQVKNKLLSGETTISTEDRLITPANNSQALAAPTNIHGIDYDSLSGALILSDVGSAAVADDGKIYVLNNTANASGLVNISATISGPNTLLGNPVDIMYSGTDLYVAEKSNNVVMRFNNILSTAGGDISADASMAFSAPESVAILPAWLNQ